MIAKIIRKAVPPVSRVRNVVCYGSRFVELSWKLLEYKFAYYHPDRLHKSWQKELTIPDATYDQLEHEYTKLALSLGKPTTITKLVGFPRDTPSGKLVESKLSQKRV